MDSLAPLSPSPDALFTELPDGTGLLLHLRSKFYFSLNRTGVAVWKALTQQQARTPRDMARHLCAHFEVEQAQAEVDVQALLSELLAEGLALSGRP